MYSQFPRFSEGQLERYSRVEFYLPEVSKMTEEYIDYLAAIENRCPVRIITHDHDCPKTVYETKPGKSFRRFASRCRLS